MIVRELVTKLGFTADNAVVRQHERSFQELKVAATAAAAAVASIGAAFGAIARETANTAQEIARGAQVANTSTEQFQRMAAAANSVGVSQEQLSDMLKDVNDKVGDFIQNNGGELQDFFTNIAPKVGVTAKMFQGLSGPAALQLYVNSLQKANLSQQEMTFYMEAIANDGTKLLPILKDNGAAIGTFGDQAAKYGAILSSSAIKQGVQFNANLRQLGLIARGLRFQLGEQLLPRLNETAQAFFNWYDANHQIISQGLDKVFDQLSGVLARVWGAGAKVVDVFQAVSGRLNSLGGAIPEVAAGLYLLARRFGGIRRVLRIGGLLLALDDLSAWMDDQPSLIGKILGPFDEVAAKIEAMQRAVQRFLRQLGVPSDIADGLSTLSVALGGLLGYQAAMLAFSSASVAMGAGLKALAGGLLAMGTGAVGKGLGAVGVLGRIASGPLAAIGLAAAPTKLGNGEATSGIDSALSDSGLTPGSEAWQMERMRLLQGGSAASGASAGGGTTTVTQNFSPTITLQVPAGTSEEQGQSLRESAKAIFDEMFSSEVQSAMVNYPRAE